MNKKAIIVIALFFFIGNAIAVRHVGYGAEVCCANTVPSDEDDYQKEIIAKFGDLYFDSSGESRGDNFWDGNVVYPTRETIQEQCSSLFC